MELDQDERRERGHVRARVVLEMLGGPKEHIEKTMKDFVEALKKIEHLEILNVEHNEAVPQDKLFTTFSEVELWFHSIDDLFGFCFDNLPSSVDILEPTEFNIPAATLVGLLNDLQAKIHKIDLALKDLTAQTNVLSTSNIALSKNLAVYALQTGKESPEDIAKIVGVKTEAMKNLLEKLVEKGSIKKEGEKYRAS